MFLFDMFVSIYFLQNASIYRMHCDVMLRTYSSFIDILVLYS